MRIECDVETPVDSHFDFAGRSYVPMRRRADPGTAVVFGRALLRQASSAERERIASWLKEPSIHLALGMRRAPSVRDVRRSRLPAGTGEMETVEFLVLAESGSAAMLDAVPDAVPIGFYLVYEARRPRSHEVDFAFAPDFPDAGTPRAVPLLRAGRVATLVYLIAVCGADRVQWVRRRAVPGESGFRTSGPVHVVTVDQLVSTLRRIGRRGTTPVVIEHD